MTSEFPCIHFALGAALGLLMLISAPAFAQAPEEGTPAQIEQLGEQLQRIDTEIQGLDRRIDSCRNMGYYRQLQWWQARRQVERDNRKVVELRRAMLTLRHTGQPGADELATQLDEIQQRQAARQGQGADVEAARQAWARVEANVKSVQQPSFDPQIPRKSR